jgi:hypothetical protein
MRDTVRREIAEDRTLEAVQYLRRKYAGLGLREATEEVFAIAPSARKRVTTSWKGKRKSKRKKAARPRKAR